MPHMKALGLVLLACAGPAGALSRLPASRVRVHSAVGHVRARVLAAESDGGGFLGGLMKKAGELFSPKDEAKQKKAELSKRQREVDTSVDKLLEGTGLFGALMAPALKTLGGAFSEAMAEQSEDVSIVLDALDRALQRDARVSQSLGGSVAAGSPMSQSFSRMSIDGVTQKRVFLVVAISGARATGSAQVQAVLDGSGAITNFDVVFNGPRVGQIRLATAGGQVQSDPDVIDVDVIDVS
ncbi:hypothetical protein KFE25_000836 [Diacronema lutheri]|uniref:Plastid lipid-associated protein/fibrillin conserved domain-containing protein n=2 Tax=Diacronema lutheri TaxID=2081491 RepID=A0A8J5XTA2_DIALT|nr:hypothetical protein KFE25_000836 [Diacronema lutheri]